MLNNKYATPQSLPPVLSSFSYSSAELHASPFIAAPPTKRRCPGPAQQPIPVPDRQAAHRPAYAGDEACAWLPDGLSGAAGPIGPASPDLSLALGRHMPGWPAPGQKRRAGP